MFTGWNMGPDSGLEVEVALAREGELSPRDMPLPLRLSSLHTESGAVTDGVQNILGRKEQLEGSQGVTCSLEWRFRKGAILPAGGGMAGQQARCPGSAHGLWVRMLPLWGPGKGCWAAFCMPRPTTPRHHALLGKVGALDCFEAGSQGSIGKTWPWAGVWPACVGLVGEWQGAKGKAIYYASLGTRP